MAKFRENDLDENLKDFKEESTIVLEFEKSIGGEIILENATVNYDRKNGYINIKGPKSQFKINTALVYGYEKTEKAILIKLDALYLKIKCQCQ